MPITHLRVSLRVEPDNIVLEQETCESRKPKSYLILIFVIHIYLLILINYIIPLYLTEISQLFIEDL